MKATKNGWTIEGTPEEVLQLIQMSANGDASTGQTKDPAKETRPMPRRNIDWKKAESLQAAGWNYKAIAEEIGTTYQTVYSHFNAISKKPKTDDTL